MIIRNERADDFPKILNLYSDLFNHGTEAEMLDKLRSSVSFVREMAFIAELNDNIIGHVIFVKVLLGDNIFVALAPSAIIPGSNREQIFERLITHAFNTAISLGYKALFAIGDPSDYGKYGFESAANYSIKMPWDFLPQSSFLVKLLAENALDGISGTVEYGDIF